MEEALRFFRAYEVWIYLLLGLVGLYFIRRFILAWQELREAVFGLERDSAQLRLNQAASVLVLILTMMVVEFVLVYFIAPAVPDAIPLPTSTLDLLASPSITLPATTPQPLQTNSNPESIPADQVTGSSCIAGQIEIIIPQNGSEVSGVVEVIGTANVPNFGFYKFEIKRPEETVWLTIQAGNSAVTAGKLGDWDTSRLTPGEYQLGLVVVDNEARSSDPCIVQLRVTRAAEETPIP